MSELGYDCDSFHGECLTVDTKPAYIVSLTRHQSIKAVPPEMSTIFLQIKFYTLTVCAVCKVPY